MIENIFDNFYVARILYIIFFVLIGIVIVGNMNKKNIKFKDKTNLKNIDMNFLFKMIFAMLFMKIVLELILPLLLKSETSVVVPIGLGQVIVDFITSCICASIFEEIVFRFGLYETLHKRMSYILSIIITSIVFSLIHTYGLDGFIILFVISAIWNYSFFKTNNLLYPILLHFINNSCSLISNQINNQTYSIGFCIISLIGIIITSLKKQKN